MRRLLRFYLDTLPRWYVWLVMDVACGATGHALVCYYRTPRLQRLWLWSWEHAPFPKWLTAR